MILILLFRPTAEILVIPTQNKLLQALLHENFVTWM